jgi:hypothetical protein
MRIHVPGFSDIWYRRGRCDVPNCFCSTSLGMQCEGPLRGCLATRLQRPQGCAKTSTPVMATKQRPSPGVGYLENGTQRALGRCGARVWITVQAGWLVVGGREAMAQGPGRPAESGHPPPRARLLSGPCWSLLSRLPSIVGGLVRGGLRVIVSFRVKYHGWLVRGIYR